MTNENKIKLILLTKWNDHHDWPSQGGLRYLYFNKSTNGFDKAFRKAGGRILVIESAFFDCIDAQNLKNQLKM